MKNKSAKNNSVIVYDFDGTCSPRDSIVKFFKIVLKHKPIKTVVYYLPQVLTGIALLKLNLISREMSYWKFRKCFFTEKNLEMFLEEFNRSVKVFDWVKKSIADDKNIAEKVICITGSPFQLIQDTAINVLNFDLLFGTRVFVNRRTKNYNQMIREEKVKQLYKTFGQNVVLKKMYTDSRDDFPLCRIAEQVIFVHRDTGQQATLTPVEFKKFDDSKKSVVSFFKN
ncbi:MAG: haloacid dehalogenase-like hydrolase [Alphaproteobacteria bacterium]|nr:haloacid dehalogenase-like hydrolase [Alphaproteobacteria bacterium]